MAVKIITKNKKAFHDYEILERFEAGIALLGTEVKSIREGRINLKESFARIKNGEVFLMQCHVSPYTHGSINNHDPVRPRKLLLHKREIKKLIGRVQEKGLTLVPLSVYLKNGKVKIEIGLCRGRKTVDKRAIQQERDQKREIEKILKNKGLR